MRDDWWWPWWVSSLIDVAVVIVALAVFRLSGRRIVKAVAGAFVVAGLVAAVMAPIVMTEEDSDAPMQGEEMPPMMP
jgi:xanthine/uracil permease